MKYLNGKEKKAWACRELLPAPGNEVVAELLTTINELRGKLSKADEFLQEIEALVGRLTNGCSSM